MPINEENMRNSLKSQAALEFIMTYGWAILVVLASIAALAYFGVLSPEKFLPQKCIMEAGMACSGHKVETDKITFVVYNGLGKPIEIDNIAIGACSSAYINNNGMNSDTDKLFTVGGSCANGAVKSTFRDDIIIDYTETDTSLQRKHYGKINTRVE